MDAPLERIARARVGLEHAERALHDEVAAARAAGHTWQDVAGVLGVTRQAAFKRFGHPVDPTTGEPLTPAPRADVGALAVAVAGDLAAGRVDELRDRMTQACSRQLTRRLVSQVWREVLSEVGELERVAHPSAHALDGGRLPGGDVELPAVGRVDLHHEAGDYWLHVVVNRSGRITGMVIRPLGVAEAWPL